MVDSGLCVVYVGEGKLFMVGENARVTGNEQGIFEEERKNRMTKVK